MPLTSVCPARLRSSAPTQKWMFARRHIDFKPCQTLLKQDCSSNTDFQTFQKFEVVNGIVDGSLSAFLRAFSVDRVLGQGRLSSTQVSMAHIENI